MDAGHAAIGDVTSPLAMIARPGNLQLERMISARSASGITWRNPSAHSETRAGSQSGAAASRAAGQRPGENAPASGKGTAGAPTGRA